MSLFMFLMSGPISYAADVSNCDPDDPAYQAKIVYRQTNDILYFDDCSIICSTGGAGVAVGGTGSLQSVVDQAIKDGKDKGVDVRIIISGDASAAGGEAGQIPSASVIKLLVAAALSDHKIPFATISNDLTLMIRDSNNEAANRLIDIAGGFGAINTTASNLGVSSDAHIGRKMLASTAGGDPNTISTKGSDTILNIIKQSQTGESKISKEYATAILGAMKAQTVNTKWGASGIPADKMAHKTGELGGAQHDVGFMFDGDKWLIVSILTNQPDGDGSQGVAIVKDTAKKIYDAWTGGTPNTGTSSVGCCSTVGSLLAGDNNAEKAYNYLVGKGYTAEQAAGAVGNMIHESGVAPMRKQGNGLNEKTSWETLSTVTGKNIYGWGIVQWDPPSKVVNGVKEMGGDPNQLNAQLDFLTKDNGLNGGAGDPQKVASAVKATKTVDEATRVFMTDFEAPGDPALANRLTFAKAIYNKATKGEPLPPEVLAHIYSGDSSDSGGTSTNSGGSSCSTPDNGECKNPFRDLKNSGPLRIDGGVDWGGQGGEGPVYPVCPAKVVKIWPTGASGSGWPGIPGSYIKYEITSGKAQGKSVYIAEDCTPSVSEGQTIGTDQPICNYVQKDKYLEIGWAENGATSGSGYVGWSDYNKDLANGNHASNSGQDMSKFLESLGAEPGIVQGPLSNTPPPADWPKW